MIAIQLIEFLSKSSELRHVLNDDEIIAPVPHHGIEMISAGSILRDEGAPGRSLLIIISGEVRLTHTDTEVNKLNPGQIFGEGAFSEEGTSSVKVEATVDSVIARFEVRKFDQFLQQSPESAQKLQNHFKELHLKRWPKWKGSATMIPENSPLLMPTMR